MSYKFYKNIFLIAILFASSISLAQLPVPFKVRYQSYIKGDMTVIANNIVNRKDFGNGPNDAYMNATKTAKLNDEFEMFYIDIDKDFSTFSSSSANLKLQNPENKKIVYVGLYWSATYKYASGIRTKKGKFKAFDKNREEFNQIKLKLPGTEKYTDIKGTTIFDGLGKKDFDESAPYVVYADITKYVSALDNPSGEYTVANIKATQGTIEGGVSGGWTMFFVYEDENDTGKFITSFDGFAGVTDKSTEILFTGFKTLPQGNVVAKLACAGLEGDTNLTGDQLQLKSEYSKDYTLISNNLKPENNFFNSSIVIDDKFFENRTPNSKNTLGYDTSLITINNPENSVIQNNSNQVTLKLKTVGDRYFMFFNAFNVEVLEIEKPKNNIVSNLKTKDKIDTNIEKVKDKTVIASVTHKKEENTKPSESKTVEKPSTNPLKTNPKKEITNVVPTRKEIVNASEENASPIVKANSKPNITNPKPETPKIAEPVINHPKVNSKPETIAKNEGLNPASISEKLHTLARNKYGKDYKPLVVPGPVVRIQNINQGFYIIAGVFAVQSNAINFLNKLRSMGLDANYFVNPSNNYRYIFISKHDNWSSALNLHYSSMNGKYFGDTWIMPINTNENQYVINCPTIINLNLFCPKQNLFKTRSKDELV